MKAMLVDNAVVLNKYLLCSIHARVVLTDWLFSTVLYLALLPEAELIDTHRWLHSDLLYASQVQVMKVL